MPEAPLTIEAVDVDGAILEGRDATTGDTRAAFLRKAGLAAGGTLMASGVLGTLPSIAGAASKKIPKGDIAILNYALTLEYLEAAFYAEAVGAGKLSGDALNFAKIVAKDEAAHVKALKSVLGKKAVAKPTFDFQGTTQDQNQFLATAYVLENTGVKAYLGQAPHIKTGALLLTAASIVTIEARHAGAVGVLTSQAITPAGPFDKGASMKTILKAVKKTGFITG